MNLWPFSDRWHSGHSLKLWLGPLELGLNSLARAWTGRIDLSQEMGFSKTLWNGLKGIFWLREVQGRSNWQVTRFLHHSEKNFQCTGIWKRDRFLNTTSGYWVSCFFCTLEGSMYAYQRMFMMLRKWSISLHWGQKLISPDAQVRVRSGWGWREWLYVCTPSSTPRPILSLYMYAKNTQGTRPEGLEGGMILCM